MLERILFALALLNAILACVGVPTWATAAAYWALVTAFWARKTVDAEKDNPSHDTIDMF